MMAPYECKLSEEMMRRAKDELNEDPKRRSEDVKHIQEWVRKQPHLSVTLDDCTIIRFLRGCKFSLEKTKEKLDMYYTCRTAIPEWFSSRDPQQERMRYLLSLGLTVPLRKCDSEGCRIMVTRSGIYDLRQVSMNDFIKVCALTIDLLMLEDENVSVSGVVVLNDSKDATLMHGLAFTPTHAKKIRTLMEDGYPLRLKAIHFINTPSTFDRVANIIKGFMKEKMKNRVHVHGCDMKRLYKHIPRDVLPPEYGGTGDTVQELKDYWFQKVASRRDWILEDEKSKVNESARRGRPKTSMDLFGLEGSFRCLNVD